MTDSLKTKQIKVKAHHKLVTSDTSFIAYHDTIINIPLRKEYYILEVNRNNVDIYDNIRNSASQHQWSKAINNFIIKAPSKKTREDTIKTYRSELYLLPYKGKIIRRLSIKKINVFGPTIYDSDAPPKNWSQRTGNFLHVNTRDFIIRQNIIFKAGDSLKPEVLADNERILRNLHYLEDARIVITDQSAKGDSVDVVIITKDVWSIAFDFSPSGVNAGYFTLIDNNIFGMGRECDNSILWNTVTVKGNELGYNGYYRFRNLYGSFIDGYFNYNDYFGTKGYHLNLVRHFYTPNTKYAGGLLYENVTAPVHVRITDTFLTQVAYVNSLVWLGRAFPLHSLHPILGRYNIVFSGGLSYINYSERPAVTSNSLYQYHDKTTLLTSVSFSKQGFYKSNLIYGYGRTEDIPYGYIITYNPGLEFDKDYKERFYNSLIIARGSYLGKIGYLYNSVSGGGFMNHGALEQGLISTNFTFFSNLGVIGLFNFRLFITGSYMAGINRFTDEYLTINDPNGIRGFSSDSIRGLQRLNLSLELVSFTPFYLLGFRCAIFAFNDWSFIGNENKNIFECPAYYALGFGFRLRNERLVFKTISIRFAFYPNLPAHAQASFITIAGETTLTPNNFYVKAPGILPFQ